MADPAVLVESQTTRPVQAKHTFRTDVQGLRAVAVGLVVAAHAGTTAVSGGFVGVDVFFVISGFLITGLLLNEASRGQISFIKFYTRRALRILPVATLVILVTAGASWYILNQTRLKSVLTEGLWASMFGANIKYGLDKTDYFTESVVSPLQHYWSLAVEEQFYLVWPIVLALIIFGPLWLMARRHNRLGRATPTESDHAVAIVPGDDPAGADASQPQSVPRILPRGRIALVLAVAGIASLALSVIQTAKEPTAAYFSTLTRSWELIVGALLAVGAPWVQRLPEVVRVSLTWLGVAGITLAAMTFTESTAFPGFAALLPVLATAAVLAGGVGAPTLGANRILGLQPFRFIGDISYSLYLWHWPILILGAAWAGGDLTTSQSLRLVAATLVLSTLSYYFVENPIRRSRRIWGSRRWTPMLMWPVAVGSVTVLALILSGLPAREPTGIAMSADMSAGPAEVEYSVLAARAGAGVPSNLTPRLEQIDADESELFECSGYKRTKNEVCQFGAATGTETVVLFGNSHATAWVPGLSAVANEKAWQFFPLVKEACAYTDYQGGDRGCSAWYKWALKEIAKLDPDLIVMNAYATSNKDWQKALAESEADLGKLTERLVVLSDPPGTRSKAADCLQPPGANLHSCMSTLTKTKLQNIAIQQQMAADADAEYIDVTSWFCWDSSCPAVVGNRVVYADGSHLSITYSRHLAAVLGPVLAEQMGR